MRSGFANVWLTGCILPLLDASPAPGEDCGDACATTLLPARSSSTSGIELPRKVSTYELLSCASSRLGLPSGWRSEDSGPSSVMAVRPSSAPPPPLPPVAVSATASFGPSSHSAQWSAAASLRRGPAAVTFAQQVAFSPKLIACAVCKHSHRNSIEVRGHSYVFPMDLCSRYGVYVDQPEGRSPFIQVLVTGGSTDCGSCAPVELPGHAHPMKPSLARGVAYLPAASLASLASCFAFWLATSRLVPAVAVPAGHFTGAFACVDCLALATEP